LAGFPLFEAPRACSETFSIPSSEGLNFLKSVRILLAEGFNPPFYPNLDYQPGRALEVAKALHADSIRFPAAAYRAFFPTKTKYPRHPMLGDQDPYGETIEQFHRAGLKVVVYLPLNHPFLPTSTPTTEQMEWTKKDAEGQPMITGHYGFETHFETCINSPLRREILKMVDEACNGYEPDIVYFDGPYQGMQADMRWCHCRYCREAYRKVHGRDVPVQDKSLRLEDEIQYVTWMRQRVMGDFLSEVKTIVRRKPMLFNDTSLLSSRQWRSLLYPIPDGFMFEAATTPEEKLFNILMGKSTGKYIWSYLGSHTVYNREHLRNRSVRGWFSYPLESEELRMDARVAMAGGAGLIYWGLARFYYMPKPDSQYESYGYVREAFELTERNAKLIEELEPVRDTGILVSGKTIDWFADRGSAYENYYHGAFDVLKDLHQQAEPFHDSQLTAEKLKHYRVLWIANAICLSDADCASISEWVHAGGKLVATNRTSLADEYGRARKDFGLAELFGASYESMLEYPDLYLRFPGSAHYPGDVVPQDLQVLVVQSHDEAEVLALNFDRGRNRLEGPALIRRRSGAGEVIFIPSGLEAVYLETHAAILRRLFEDLLAAWSTQRLYDLKAPAGVWGHLAQAPGHIVLHLVANTGNKWKKLQTREQFLPAGPIEARVRVPSPVQRAWRLSDHEPLPFRLENGYATFRLPEIKIHEGLVLELS